MSGKYSWWGYGLPCKLFQPLDRHHFNMRRIIILIEEHPLSLNQRCWFFFSAELDLSRQIPCNRPICYRLVWLVLLAQVSLNSWMTKSKLLCLFLNIYDEWHFDPKVFSGRFRRTLHIFYVSFLRIFWKDDFSNTELLEPPLLFTYASSPIPICYINIPRTFHCNISFT